MRGREASIVSYSYDYPSRLSTSTFHNYSDAGVISGTNNYNENLTYDLRGNIQTLQRTGFYQNGSTCTYGQIDNLSYSYSPNTNRLHKVLDGTVTAGDAKSRGFNGNLSTADNSMDYDRNGNLNKNLHKNVSTITYNHLNLPTVITFTTGNTIEFLYDAAGMKLRKTVKVGATVQYVQDYLPGGIEYRQTGTGVKRVESVFHAEGRYYNTNVDANNTISWRREYNIKDHLGNTRLVFTDRNANGVVDITGTASTSDILQENHYYAFGLPFEGAWLMNDAGVRDNKYQYNGKELNDDFGLNWNDYGARWYDASVGRWNGVDVKSELYMPYSPYCYTIDRPINAIDPNGQLVIFINGNHFTPEGKAPGEPYWNKYDKYVKGYNHSHLNATGDYARPIYGTKISMDFDGAIMDQIGDHNAMYVDGSLGGWAPLGGQVKTSVRQHAGYVQGYQDAKDIIKKITGANGEINETIKVITHSMGGAFAKYYIQAILDYAEHNSIKGVVFEFEADFAPFQPGNQAAVPGVPTYQFSNEHDSVANSLISPFMMIPGAKYVENDPSKDKGHDIMYFWDKIKKLPSGNYKVINGEVVKE